MHIFKWVVVLAVFWMFLSGYFQPLLLSFGVVSVLLVVVLLKRMDDVDEEPQRLNTGIKISQYTVWLLGQIVSSSIHVTKLIWGSSSKLSPSLNKVPATNVPKNKQVLYANSITLTPGTLSVDLDDESITVHALQADSINELKEGFMEEKISKTWNKCA